MVLLSTTTVTFPHARRHCNFRTAYFQNQLGLHRSHEQPLQRKFLPVLKSEGLYLSLSLLRDKSFVCKSSEMITWVDTKVPKPIRPYFKLARLFDDLAIWLHAWSAFWYAWIQINLLCFFLTFFLCPFY
jgi:hypothetical protein